MKALVTPIVVVLSLWTASEAQAIWPWGNGKTQKVPASTSGGTPLIGGKPVYTTAAGPSTWDKFASGTKKVASGTVDVLTLKPIRDKWSTSGPTKPTPPTPPTPVKASKSSWFGSWFKPKPPEKKIKTVGDWMGQPMPKP